MATPSLYRSIVRITYTWGNQGSSSQGSGLLVSQDGLILTNNHVVSDASLGTAFGEIRVDLLESPDQLPLGNWPARIVIRNEALDLALLKLDSDIPLSFVDILRAPYISPSVIEQRIRIFGYPGLGGDTLTVTHGIVSGFDENRNLKTDAEINPGNSGGGAFNDASEFLGIPSFIVADGSGKIGFIISIDRVTDWLKTILKDVAPPTTRETISLTFAALDLRFSDSDIDQGSAKPKLLGKFAAVETLLARKNYADAISHLEYILLYRPQSALAHSYYGNALLGLERFSEAADRYREALKCDPQHIPSLGNLGVALINLLRYTEALQIFEQITGATDDPAQLWAAYHNIGKIYDTWGNPSLAAPYKLKAGELRSAAVQRMAEYTSPSTRSDGLSRLTRALVEAEIELGKDDIRHREVSSGLSVEHKVDG
jgi:V8-like Glu-specific endopeptidase